MQDILENYIQLISSKFAYVETSEMGYRADFETLLKRIFESIKDTHIFHDAKAIEGNKPDFVVLKDKIPLLYIEAKDIGISLDKIEKSEQMSRYFGYTNLVLTDYLEFRFYRDGIRYGEPIKIAGYDIKNRTITPIPENYEYIARTLLDFTQSQKEPIRSGEHLSKIMGGKAQRIRDNVRQFLATESDKNAELARVYETIKKLLVHDLTKESFADMYAQTLVYGLFVARYHDDKPETFSRQEARDLIPASNPFLGNFFDHIAGRNFEKRLAYIVDELCEVFTHANVTELMEQHFKVSSKKGTERGQDQVIHFYEDFLKEYDDDLRKRMGAYYTPLPVVQFIVRSVDYLLEKEFGLTDGLASTTKTKDGVHKVQILDPAVGTGTFISDVIGKIYKRVIKGGQEGRWPGYVHYNLLPRLHGFELMMAPYTIAHLKLSMALEKTGFHTFYETREGKSRLGIYLTNSLEEAPVQEGLFTAFGFAESIAQESKEAAKIKTEKPIMVVLGNPPYSVSSSNKGKWITEQIKVYKENLNERNIQPLSDDYIKFIRFAEHFIEKNGSGIVAMITNNSFLSGRIHRQMRKHLLETFNSIYILNLHGNSRIGGLKSDENVFDIQQGVSINIFIRNDVNKKLGSAYYAELLGNREEKFKSLSDNSIDSIKWQNLNLSEPYYYLVPKDFKNEGEYNKGFSVVELFIQHSSGATSARDNLLIKHTKGEVNKLRSYFEQKNDEEIGSIYGVDKKQVTSVRSDLANAVGDSTEILYRPFDVRQTIYSLKSEGVFSRPRSEIMIHMLKDNTGFIAKQGLDQKGSPFCFVSRHIIDRRSWTRPGMLGAEQLFPLYIYQADGSKIPNVDEEIVAHLEKTVGKTTPEDILDYVYAVLHSQKYSEKYEEFLKIDFPRVPYPKDKKQFQSLVKLGGKLRELHLFDSPKLNKFITTYPEGGDDMVEKIEYKDGKVFINPTQYFGKVPKVAWNFWIGGYQPAQKWLKDRKGRELTNEDIEHYQKIIVALAETDRMMKEIERAWKV